jgi:hypothetical protein
MTYYPYFDYDQKFICDLLSGFLPGGEAERNGAIVTYKVTRPKYREDLTLFVGMTREGEFVQIDGLEGVRVYRELSAFTDNLEKLREFFYVGKAN